MEPANAATDIGELTARAAQVLAQTDGAQAALRQLIHLAVASSSCDFASVTVLMPGRRPHPVAVSDSLARWLDAVQCDSGEGPMMEVLERGSICHSPDLTHEARWSRFSPLAADRGIRSVVACRLTHPAERARALGSLNLYAERPGAFAGGSPQRSAAVVRAADLVAPGGRVELAPDTRRSGSPGASVASLAFDDRIAIRIVGEIDRSSTPSLRLHLDDLLEIGICHIEIDLSDVTFMDTDGIRLLVEMHRRFDASHGRLVLSSPSAVVRRILALTGAGQVLPVDEGR